MKSTNGCPFCKHFIVQIVKSTPPAIEGVQAECDNCGARGPIYHTKKEALIGWEHGILDLEGRQRKC